MAFQRYYVHQKQSAPNGLTTQSVYVLKSTSPDFSTKLLMFLSACCNTSVSSIQYGPDPLKWKGVKKCFVTYHDNPHFMDETYTGI